MEWIEVKLYIKNEVIDIVTATLYEVGISGAIIDDEADMISFLQNDEEDKWDYVDESLLIPTDKETNIVFYVSANEYGREMLLAAQKSLEILKEDNSEIDFGRLFMEFANVSDESWLNEWKKHYKPFKIGKGIIIRPEWEEYDKKEGETVLVLNPGNAFGTGLHQTTKICLEALEKYLKKDDNVLDLGCGTGILSVAAMLLGANKALAVDFDENAVAIANENAVRNGIDVKKYKAISKNLIKDKLNIDNFENMMYNIVVANIVADVIISIADFANSMLVNDGLFISSGIISERLPEVLEVIKLNKFEVLEVIRLDDWCAVIGKKSGE